MDNSWIEAVNERLEIILEEAVFDERSEKIFKLHFGVNCKRLDPKGIAKEVKMPMKKLKPELAKIDNKVFNILKKHDFISWLTETDR